MTLNNNIDPSNNSVLKKLDNKLNNNTNIWFKDPTVLIDKNSFFQIWPCQNMSREEKINSITRLIIYLTFFGYLITQNLNILNKKHLQFLDKLNKESFSNEQIYENLKHNFTNPNTKNPNMNILLPEINDNPERLVAAPSYNKAVERQINDSVKNIVRNNFKDPNIDEKLFRSNENEFSPDEFQFEQSMRQFYTTPNTNVPNNQKEFAQFCYGNMASCKDGDVEQCLKNAPRHINM
jgi:Txe/YoeB family toxin of Txe-Axe toxin-antitoxin module